MTWPETVGDLAREQRALAARKPPHWRPSVTDYSSGACFVCFPRGSPGIGSRGDPAWVGAALIDYLGGLTTAVVTGVAGASYQAGFLALREGPLLEAAIRSLATLPDILLVNATGLDHPRRAGLALHLSAVLGIPSIGVTHRPLLASDPISEPLAAARGATHPLILDGQRVGSLLRTRRGCRALAVHAGWRTSPETATEVVLALSSAARTPEPLRRAREAARTARSVLDLHDAR